MPAQTLSANEGDDRRDRIMSLSQIGQKCRDTIYRVRPISRRILEERTGCILSLQPLQHRVRLRIDDNGHDNVVSLRSPSLFRKLHHGAYQSDGRYDNANFQITTNVGTRNCVSASLKPNDAHNNAASRNKADFAFSPLTPTPRS